MSCKRFFSFAVLVFGLICSPFFSIGQPAENAPAAEAGAEHSSEPDGVKKEGINLTELVFGHVADSHEWHFFSIGEKSVAVPLPCIVYREGTGIEVFSSHEFGECEEREGAIKKSHSYNGMHLERGMKEKIVADDGSQVLDFSITKNTLSMLISVVLILWIGLSVAKKYKQGGPSKAPTGFQNALESAIFFIRDEVAKPNLGHKYHKYMPMLLTVFFFIWINNLLGLLPGGANFTGNIAVTLCLSIISFVVMLVRANKHFWGHLLNPPGVPTGIKFLLVPIEIISLFIKPVALTIRLFANMLAGHIVILCVISMIFIFAGLSKFAGIGFVPVSIAFAIFMFMLELLVAAIQAFIFTNLTTVFIGQAIEETHDHHEGGQEYDVSHNEIIA
jgi:F-type H+-transporting ATPase subunit a